MAVDAQIDKLRIDIETNITSDPKRIDEIYESLKRLKSITEEKWSGLDEIANKINKLGTINQTSFSQFNQSLQTITSGITNLQQVAATPFQTEQGRLLKELEIVSSRINDVQSRYESLSQMSSLFGKEFSELTKEQRALFFELMNSGKSVEDIQREQVALSQSLINQYRRLDSIQNKLTGNMQRTSQVDLASAFNAQKNALREVTAEYNTLAKTLGVLSPEATQMAVQIGLGNQELKQLGAQLTQLDPTQTEKVANATFRYDEVLRRINVNQTIAANRATELGKATDFAGKSAIKGSSAFDKLILSIKRITFYRVVRRAIQLIGKEITNSIKNFVLFDDATNEAISGLMSSWKTMANSFAVVFSQLLITAAPLLIRILDLATDVANAISLIFATISGEETYSKAIKNEEDYREALEQTNKQLLGFDRFNVLQGQDVKPLFEEVEASTGWAEMSDTTLALISALETLIAIKVGSWLIALVAGLEGATIATKALTLASNLLLAAGIFALVFGIQYLVKNWDNMSDTMKGVGVALVTLAGIFTATILLVKLGLISLSTAFAATGIGAIIIAIGLAIYLLYQNWDKVVSFFRTTIRTVGQWFQDLWNGIKNVAKGIANAFIFAINTVIDVFENLINGIIDGMNVVIKGLNKVPGVDINYIAHVNWQIPKIQNFAKGGIPDTQGGSMFIMNEGGNPELIHENSRGQVQISNQESLRGAFLEALRQHDMEKQSRGQEVTVSVELQPNGNALARALNPYLRQETVRTGR